MRDKLDELHYIYKMIGNYGFCTVQELLDKYNNQKEIIDKANECIKKFLCSKEYIDVEGIAIANNYETILNILNEVSE